MSIQKFFKEALQWKLAGGAQSAGVATFATDPLTGVATGLTTPTGQVMTISNLARKQFRSKLLGNLVISTSGQITRHATLTMPVDWAAWKVRCWNSVGTSIPNHLVSVAPTSNVSSPYTPTGIWTPALFGGVAAHTIPAANAQDGQNFVAGTIESDVQFIPSVARDDGGSGSIVMIRNAIPVGAPANNSRYDSAIASVPNFSQYGWNSYYQTAVDGITTPASFNAPTQGATLPPVEFIGYTSAMVKRVTFIGSSTFAGVGDTGSDGMGWVRRSQTLLNATGSIAYAFTVDGVSGAQTTWTVKKIPIELAFDGIDAAVFATYSTNDTDRATQAGMDRVIGQALYFIDECYKRGITPILSTFQAVTGDTGTYHDNRKAVNARIRTIATSLGLKVIDFELWLSSLGSTGAWLNAAYTDDGTHPNSAGHAYVASLAAPVIASAI